MDFRKNSSTRQEYREGINNGRAGKLYPVMCVPFRPGESGVLSQTITVEMEPVSGRLTSDIYANVIAVYVPALACDVALNPEDAYAGNVEVFREKLLDGVSPFPMESENELTRRMGIVPRFDPPGASINSIASLSHNVAVNHLRQMKYIRATQIDAKTNRSVTPSLLSTTVLDRFNAVLEPEDKVNGAVNLSGVIPIKGIGITTAGTPTSRNAATTGGDAWETFDGWKSDPNSDGTGATAKLHIEADANNPGHPLIRADLGDSGSSIKLDDFYKAEQMDRLARQMNEWVLRNPQYGFEQLTRMVHGLEIETGKVPFVIFDDTVSLRRGIRSGMDGAGLDVRQTSMDTVVEFTVPVLRNEFGGCVITFLQVKPEEVIEDQPHPILTDDWRVPNFAAQSLAIEPVPVTFSDLTVSPDPGTEDTVAFWVAPEGFPTQYMRYGWDRGVDPETVDHRNAVWQYAIPLSVAPDNIIYPENLDHYPFALNGPEDPAFSYTTLSTTSIGSPWIVGPSPIEEMEIIEDAELFGEHDPQYDPLA